MVDEPAVLVHFLSTQNPVGGEEVATTLCTPGERLSGKEIRETRDPREVTCPKCRAKVQRLT